MYLSLPIPAVSIFMFSLISSIIMILSSMNWLFIWIAFELNLISFVPLILMKFSTHNSAASIKYFLVQASGSAILLSSIGLNSSPSFYKLSSSIVLIFAILMKMGSAPIHLWLPSVVNNISWPNSLIILSLQKLAPILILTKLFTSWNLNFVTLISLLNAILGGLGGLNQTSLKGVLVYSSISHLGWVLSMLNFWVTSLTYFTFYVLILSMMILPIILYQTFKSFPLSFSSNFNTISLPIFINLMSMGGLPPLLGFFPKWMALLNLNLWTTMFILVLSSLINLFFYSSIIFSNMSPSYKLPSLSNFNMINLLLPNLILPSLFFI